MKRQAVSKWSEQNYKEKSDSKSEAPVNLRTVAGLVLARFIGAKLSLIKHAKYAGKFSMIIVLF